MFSSVSWALKAGMTALKVVSATEMDKASFDSLLLFIILSFREMVIMNDNMNGKHESEM
jgi:hypothetical protein